MRRGENGEVLMDASQFVGFNLGADFCSEHEWGIEKTKSKFGIPFVKAEHNKFIDPVKEPIPVFGITRRTAITFPEECLIYLEDEDAAVLLFNESFWKKSEYIEKVKKSGILKEVNNSSRQGSSLSELRLREKQDFCGAWSDGSFGVLVKGEQNKKYLKELYEAMQRKDFAIWIGGGVGFISNPGLNLIIVSRVSDANRKLLEDGDKSIYELRLAAQKTGIYQKIDKVTNEEREENRKNNNYSSIIHGYMALSPKYVSESDKTKTKYPVIFWLNPSDQKINNYGWFTVEELEEWLENKGPIPKQEVCKT
jgi:hypothetical protein